MKKIIIFLGVPGSGKGTQAELIAKKYKYTHISTGDMLRNLETKKDINKEDKKELEKMKSGKLVSNRLIYKLIFTEIENNLARGAGVVLDGVIRSAEQAEKFQKFFDEKSLSNEVIVIDVSISDKTSLKRLMYRKANSSQVRLDDNLKIMKKRIKEQGNEANRPILFFYEGIGVIKRVNGERSIEEVHKDVIEILEKYVQKD